MEEITRWRITFVSPWSPWHRQERCGNGVMLRLVNWKHVVHQFLMFRLQSCFFEEMRDAFFFPGIFWPYANLWCFSFDGMHAMVEGWFSRPQTSSFHWSNRTQSISRSWFDRISTTQLDYADGSRTCCADDYATLAVAWRQPQGLMILNDFDAWGFVLRRWSVVALRWIWRSGLRLSRFWSEILPFLENSQDFGTLDFRLSRSHDMVVAAKAGLETLVALRFHQPKFNPGSGEKCKTCRWRLELWFLAIHCYLMLFVICNDFFVKSH